MSMDILLCNVDVQCKDINNSNNYMGSDDEHALHRAEINEIFKKAVNGLYHIKNVSIEVLEKDPWEKSCALLVLFGKFRLPSQSFPVLFVNRVYQFSSQGGRLLAIGSASFLFLPSMKNFCKFLNEYFSLEACSDSVQNDNLLINFHDPVQSNGISNQLLKPLSQELFRVKLNSKAENSIGMVNVMATSGASDGSKNIFVASFKEIVSKGDGTECSLGSMAISTLPFPWIDHNQSISNLEILKTLLYTQIGLKSPWINDSINTNLKGTDGGINSSFERSPLINVPLERTPVICFTKKPDLSSQIRSVSSLHSMLFEDLSLNGETADAESVIIDEEFTKSKDFTSSLLLNEINGSFNLTKDWSFSPLKFFNLLNAKGESESHLDCNTLFYTECIGSTQTFLQNHPLLVKALPSFSIVLAGHQVAGRGRSSNGWLSSTGCLQFTMVVHNTAINAGNEEVVNSSKSTTSALKDAPLICPASLVQHLVALSMANAIKCIDPKIPILLKWPNDLYTTAMDGTDPKKVGGILVQSIGANSESFLVGFGINIYDTPWTRSLNDLASEPFSKEQVLSAFVSQFAPAMRRLMAMGALFFPYDQYYSFWMHNGQRTTVHSESGEWLISGIDQQGFILAKSLTDQDRQIALQPDGNSFDLTMNMICKK